MTFKEATRIANEQTKRTGRYITAVPLREFEGEQLTNEWVFSNEHDPTLVAIFHADPLWQSSWQQRSRVAKHDAGAS